MNCFVCKEPISDQEVQQPIYYLKEVKPAHYSCGTKQTLSYIEVFRIEHGGTSYLDHTTNCLDALKDIEEGDEYVVSKVKINYGKYHALPEFGGF